MGSNSQEINDLLKEQAKLGQAIEYLQDSQRRWEKKAKKMDKKAKKMDKKSTKAAKRSETIKARIALIENEVKSLLEHYEQVKIALDNTSEDIGSESSFEDDSETDDDSFFESDSSDDFLDTVREALIGS